MRKPLQTGLRRSEGPKDWQENHHNDEQQHGQGQTYLEEVAEAVTTRTQHQDVDGMPERRDERH